MIQGSAVSALSLAIGVGGVVSLVSVRLGIPPLLPLMATGMVLGVNGLKWIDAPAQLGVGLKGLIGVAIALLVFEGALLLDKQTLKQAPRAVRGLLTTSVLVGWTVTFLAGVHLLGLSYGTAAVLGAVLIVTGPTVIQPLLKKVRLAPRLHSALLGEGILIDPIGVIATFVTLEVVLAARAADMAGITTVEVVMRFLSPFLWGGAFGIVAGAIAAFLASRGKLWHGKEGEHGVVGLCAGLTFAAAGVAELFAHDAGIVAATVVGMILAWTLKGPLAPLRHAMDRMARLLIATLFVLLAAGFDLKRLMAASWREAAFVAAVILLARPVAVLVGTWRSGLSWGEVGYLGLVGPKGVVAVSAAALAAQRLAGEGATDLQRAEAATMMTVMLAIVVITVVWLSVMGSPLAGLLKVRGPERNGVLIVGAHAIARELARKLMTAGFEVKLVDRSASRVSTANSTGLVAVEGDATDGRWMERDVETPLTGYVMAMTGNVDVDTMVERWGEHHLGQGRAKRWPGSGEEAKRLLAFAVGTEIPAAGSVGELTRLGLSAAEAAVEAGEVTVVESGRPVGPMVVGRDERKVRFGEGGRVWYSLERVEGGLK